jgi:hypothetical protein
MLCVVPSSTLMPTSLYAVNVNWIVPTRAK